jgi:hypothetical protein
MDLLRDVGAFAGLAAFFGLAVLALLYFAQARDVRRLRENAEFLVEGDAGAPAPSRGEVPTSVDTEAEPERAARAAAASAPNDAEAFRRAELARQAAERRQRFESRRRDGGGGLGERFGNLPSGAVIAVGAVILIAGIAFGASQFLGDDEPATGGGGGGGKQLACPPGQTKVAVLNGTAEAGLASQSASQLKQKSYDVGPVSNTESGFDTSTIMFDQGGEQCVPEIAPLVGVTASAPMDQEIRTVAEGAVVAVVLGEDRATGSSDTATEDAAAGDTSAETLGD